MGPTGEPYVAATELVNYFPSAVLDQFTDDQKEAACVEASKEADSYMRGRYRMPLLAWGADVKKNTAYIAIYNLCTALGFAPSAGADQNITKNYYSAVGWPDRPGSGWFPGIQRQAIHPDVTPSVDPVNDSTYGLPQVSSLPMAGWQRTINGKRVV